MPSTISKAVFLAGLECPKQSWFKFHSRPLDRDSAKVFLTEQGRRVGETARQRFPGGILVDSPVFESAHETTRELLADRPGTTLFEAAFQIHPFVARADILVPENNSWHLIEVKSGTRFKTEYLDDAAYTFMVASDSGIDISRVSVMYLNPDFTSGDNPELQFLLEDVTHAARQKADDFRSVRKELARDSLADLPPQANFVFACKTCPYFLEDCLGKNMENPIFKLPGLSQKQFRALTTAGIGEVSDVPATRLVNAKQIAVKKAITSQERVIKKVELQRLLDQIKWPVFYLDFETYAVAMPRIPSVKPYEQFPTQYSLHVYSAPDECDGHSEFLAEPNVDCREELVRRLINDAGACGSIVTYSHFETTIIENLIKRFPSYKPELSSLVERIFDLRKVFSEAVFDPNCQGSESIKHTLPAFTTMSYQDLEIQNGFQAIVEYDRLADPSLLEPDVQSKREALLAYCQRDTLAMAELHFALIRLLK